MSPERPTIEFDHHAPGFAEDPWASYRSMRERCPVAWSEAHGGFWVVSRYEDVSRIARDDVTFSSAREVVLPATGSGRLIPLNSDPPDLLRYRKALQPFFTVAASEGLAPMIERFTTACIDAFIERGSADLVLALANPVPTLTTLHLLGLPLADWRLYVEPVHAVTVYRAGEPAQLAAQADIAHLRERLTATIETDGDAFPRDRVVGHLLELESEGRIDRAEVIDLVWMTLFGGLDTTMAALGNALVYLDAHPEAAEGLRHDPALLPHAIDELLRWEAPVQGFARTVTADCVIGDQVVPRGDTVFMLWASANRDPEQFEEAEDVRLERHPNRHLTFGIGGHRCLGATLARVEMRVMLAQILRRLPDMRIGSRSRPETVGNLYAWTSLEGSFSPGPTEGDLDPRELDL